MSREIIFELIVKIETLIIILFLDILIGDRINDYLSKVPRLLSFDNP